MPALHDLTPEERDPENSALIMLLERFYQHTALVQGISAAEKRGILNRARTRLLTPEAIPVEDLSLEHEVSRQKHPASVSPETYQPFVLPADISQRRLKTRANNAPVLATRTSFRQRLNLLIAALLVALLVGSLVVVEQHALHYSTTGSKHAQKLSTRTPTPGPVFGQILYTTPPNPFGFGAFSWSPESTRIASLLQSGIVQIWDATTGGHLVTVHMPGANEYASDMAWSPNSPFIAISTDREILWVNGQTGAIVKTYSPPIAHSLAGGNSIPLVETLPANGGPLFSDLAWSPDGRFLAVSMQEKGTESQIQVLNAQNGTLAFRLPVSGNYFAGRLAWSSDGQDLAASLSISTIQSPPHPTPQDQLVRVWNISTRQVVFQQPGGDDDGLAWQPGSHTLALAHYSPKSGEGLIGTLEIWDVLANQELKHYPSRDVQDVEWSPDGRYLAYAGVASGEVIIMNPESGQHVYVYHVSKQTSVTQFSWSPNGKYIVSGEFTTHLVASNLVHEKAVAKVWTA